MKNETVHNIWSSNSEISVSSTNKNKILQNLHFTTDFLIDMANDTVAYNSREHWILSY